MREVGRILEIAEGRHAVRCSARLRSGGGRASQAPQPRRPAPARSGASAPSSERSFGERGSRPLRHSWPPCPRPTTRSSEKPTRRISALSPAGRSGPSARCALAVGPLRHDVVIPQQHAVERPGGGDQFVAVLGEDDALDQFIDRRILDADEIARAGLVGGLRTPEAALLVAGRQRLPPGARR